MKTYAVMCRRMVEQRVCVTVTATNAAEARALVRDGTVPVQWPDGNYLAPKHPATLITATPTGKE